MASNNNEEQFEDPGMIEDPDQVDGFEDGSGDDSDDSGASAQAKDDEAKAKRKKQTNLIIASAVAVALGFTGYKAYNMFAAPPPAKAKQVKPLPPDPLQQAAAAPDAGVPGQAPQQAVQVQMPTAQTGGASMPGMPGVPAGTPTDAKPSDAAPGGVTVAAGGAAVSVAAGGVKVDVAAVPVPAGGQAPAPVVVQVAAQPPVDATPPQIKQADSGVQQKPVEKETITPLVPGDQSGVGKALDDLKVQIGEIHSAVKDLVKLNVGTRLDDVERRLSKLESGSSVKRASKAVESSDGASVRAKAPAAKRSYKLAKPADRSDGSDGLLFSKEPKHQEKVSQEKAKKERSFSLQAVIANRIWVKNTDGSSLTFVQGETLPNGDKVLKIDAEKGTVQTSGGYLD